MFFRRTKALVFATLLGLGSSAAAATVECTGSPTVADSVCSATSTVIGSSFNIFEFDVVNSGGYRLTLTDFAFPTQPLQSLSAMLTTSTATVSMLDMAGSITFFLMPGTYFLQVSAAVAPGETSGLYGVSVVLANPVPLPPALTLLLSAVALFWYTQRRSRKAASNDAIAVEPFAGRLQAAA
ncbi:MAG: hypothetical protein AAFZ58_12975 [Pseudomonadota bacterium]